MNETEFQKLIVDAEAGDAKSLRRAAECYETGDGVKRSLSRAAHYYALAAELGEKRAYFALGNLYRYGAGIGRDEDRAERCYRLSGQAGVAAGYRELARMNGERNRAESLPELWKRAAESGDPEGEYRYALLLIGRGGAENARAAERYFRLSEKSGYFQAAFELGKLAEESGDFVAAATYYRKGAENGDPRAALMFANLAETGKGIPKDAALALRFYREAYRKGEKAAAFPLARFCFEGIAGKADFERAARYLEEAVSAGHAEACVYAGRLSEHGKFGTARDEIHAASLYRRAAELGQADGKAFYGKTVLLGIGEPADYGKGFRLVSESAAENSPYGIYFLAFCHEKGFGTPIDIPTALGLYREAAKYGVFDAADRLADRKMKLEIKELRRDELPALYRERFVKDFHNAELMRPYKRLIRLLDEGKYVAVGFFCDGALAAYQFFSKTGNLILLDFFAVVPELRGTGVGSAALAALSAAYPDAAIVLEAEDPEAAANETDCAVCERRVRFYRKNGFTAFPKKVSLFGCPYLVLTKNAPMDDAELTESLKKLYENLYTKKVCRKNIRIL